MSELREGPWHRLPGVPVVPQRRVYAWLRACRVYERYTTRTTWLKRMFDVYEEPTTPSLALRSVHDLVALAQSTLWEPLLEKLPEEVQRMVYDAYVVGTEEVAFQQLERNHYCCSQRMWEQIPRGYQRMWEGFLQEIEHRGTTLEEEQRKAVYASVLTPSEQARDGLFRRHILCDEWRRKEMLFHLLRGIRRMRPSPWADRALLDPFGART